MISYDIISLNYIVYCLIATPQNLLLGIYKQNKKQEAINMRPIHRQEQGQKVQQPHKQKQPQKKTETQMLKLPIIQKLKSMKTELYVQKLIHELECFHAERGKVIDYGVKRLTQVWMVFVIEGSIQVEAELQRDVRNRCNTQGSFSCGLRNSKNLANILILEAFNDSINISRKPSNTQKQHSPINQNFLTQKPRQSLQTQCNNFFNLLSPPGQSQVQNNSLQPQIELQKQPLTSNQTYHPKSYFFIDGRTVKLTFKQQSKYYIANQKNLFELFDGVIPLPFITNRLRQMRKNQLFNSMERKKISKIASSAEEQRLHIGTKLSTQLLDQQSGQKKRYCYYIVQGEVKIFRNGYAVCVLGSNQIFGAPPQKDDQFQISNQEHESKLKGSIGKVITQTSQIYKIPAELVLKSSKVAAQYVNKRVKWRENRLTKIVNIAQAQKQKKKKVQQVKQKASFVDKQIVMRSFYFDSKIEDLQKMKVYCKKQELKCQSRQQYYNKKLQKIWKLQRQRYGSHQNEVLFPIPLGRTYTNMAKTIGISTNSNSKISTPKKNSFKIRTQPSTPAALTSQKRRANFKKDFFN